MAHICRGDYLQVSSANKTHENHLICSLEYCKK